MELERGARGHEGAAERFEKIVAVFEIIAGVAISFCQDRNLDHVEDELAEIFAVANAPFAQHGDRHGAVLLKGVGANALKQFLTTYVIDFVLAAAAEEFLGMIEGFADKQVGFA